MLTVKLYCIDINRTSECLAASFYASCCYQYQSSAVSHQHVLVHVYLTFFTGENLQVFQSDPSCFQQPLDEILSRIDFRKILCSVGHWLLNSMIFGFWKSIRKQRFYTSLNVVVHYFFYRVYKICNVWVPTN